MMTEANHLSDLEIEALLDGALEGGAAREARAHLAAWGACARRVAARARLFAALETWEDTPPSRDLTPGIVQQLSYRRTPLGLSLAPAGPAGPARPPRGGSGRPPPAALLIAFTALIAVLFGLFASAAALFPRGVWLAQRAAEESPGRSLPIGAVNPAFFLAIR